MDQSMVVSKKIMNTQEERGKVKSDNKDIGTEMRRSVI